VRVPKPKIVTVIYLLLLGIRGTIIALGIVWGFSVVVSVPTAVNFDVVLDDHSNDSHEVCETTWNELQTSVYSLFLLAVSYLVPQVRLV